MGAVVRILSMTLVLLVVGRAGLLGRGRICAPRAAGTKPRQAESERTEGRETFGTAGAEGPGLSLELLAAVLFSIGTVPGFQRNRRARRT